jgi:Flp pilus assembly protein TadG
MDGARRNGHLPLSTAQPAPRSGPATGRAASSSGQAVVELVLALPALVVIAMLVLAGGRLLATSVALTDAARAGAVAAASAVARGQTSQAPGDASAAATAEGLTLSCSGDGVPEGCVGVQTQAGDASGEQMEVVTVYDLVDTGFPGLAPIQIHAQAAATP